MTIKRNGPNLTQAERSARLRARRAAEQAILRKKLTARDRALRAIAERDLTLRQAKTLARETLDAG
jgi:hypothetical protein